jgi:hypothetical protein
MYSFMPKRCSVFAGQQSSCCITPDPSLKLFNHHTSNKLPDLLVAAQRSSRAPVGFEATDRPGGQDSKGRERKIAYTDELLAETKKFCQPSEGKQREGPLEQ